MHMIIDSDFKMIHNDTLEKIFTITALYIRKKHVISEELYIKYISDK